MGRSRHQARIRESGNLAARHVHPPRARPVLPGIGRLGLGATDAEGHDMPAADPRTGSRPAAHPSIFLRLLLLVLLLAASIASAQPTPGTTLRGVVTDPAGARLPHATLTLASPLAIVATTEADALGEYRFEGVAPGRYELRVAAPGFRSDVLALTVTGGSEAAATGVEENACAWPISRHMPRRGSAISSINASWISGEIS
jgi:hypothetical protein